MITHKAVCIPIFALLLVSCGLETEAFLEPVEIVDSNNNGAEIVLPDQTSIPDPDLFRHYAIYYRIYLSDFLLPSGVTINLSPLRKQINAMLEEHFTALHRYTTTDNVSPSAVDLEFRTLKYYSLFLEEAFGAKAERDLSAVLNSPAPGTIRLEFLNNEKSILIDTSKPAASNSYVLLRASTVSFTSMPNRLFTLSSSEEDLLDGSLVSNNVNADIEKKTTGDVKGSSAYVSMYIFATGMDYNYSLLYSRIKHLGIFELKRL